MPNALLNTSKIAHLTTIHQLSTLNLLAWFIFLVGKTELAKQVARYLHKDNKKVHEAKSGYIIFISIEIKLIIED